MDSATALSELKQFQSSRKGASDYYNDAQKEFGVGDVKTRADDLRGVIRNTETALKGVNASVGGRTRGQLVTEAQRARLENMERQPLMEGIASQQGALSDEMASYRDLLGQAGTQSGLRYQTDTDRQTALESNYNRIYQAEQAAAEAARQERAFQESIRQFNESQAAAKRISDSQNAAMARFNASSGGGFSIPSGGGGNPARNAAIAAQAERERRLASATKKDQAVQAKNTAAQRSLKKAQSDPIYALLNGLSGGRIDY
jgi:hypothetical protein